MTAAHQILAIPLIRVAPGRWTTVAGPEWSNPGGGLWGGYAIGLCVRVLEAEPEAVGEPLSLTLTYAAGLPAGPLDIRTRRLRQGGSIGVWEVEVLPATVEDLAEVGDDFILVECEGRVGGGGASDERSSYWRRDGKLLATSEQLAWYREVRQGSPE